MTLLIRLCSLVWIYSPGLQGLYIKRRLCRSHTCTRTNKARPRALIRHKGTSARLWDVRMCVNGTGQRIRASGLPYLHALDGLISVPHRTDLVEHGLVRQQQLVEDLQRPGPVPDRFQRHDPYEMRMKGFGSAVADVWRFGSSRVLWIRGVLKQGESRARCGRSLKACPDWGKKRTAHGTACSLSGERKKPRPSGPAHICQSSSSRDCALASVCCVWHSAEALFS